MFCGRRANIQHKGCYSHPIYGNFFYQNPSGEPLFQGEGNVALYDNLFVNTSGDAIWIQPQNDVPRMIRAFNNTLVASGTGIRVVGGSAAYQQKVIGNAVFAATSIEVDDQADNITDTFANASLYLVNPTGTPGQLDLYPLAGKLVGAPLDSGWYQSFLQSDRDFNGIVTTAPSGEPMPAQGPILAGCRSWSANRSSGHGTMRSTHRCS